MLPPVFYVPPDRIENNTATLPSDEAKHAVRVMRLSVGAMIIVVDGLGTAYRAELTAASPRKVTARFHATVRDFGEANVHLTLAAGLSAGTRFDSVVQRGTELGVKRFVPLVTEKSKVVIADPRRARSRVTRLEKVALAAMKQCRRSIIPSIALPTTFDDFLSEHDTETTALVFHTGKQAGRFDDIFLDSQTRRITLLVGPEAGFTDDEAVRAIEAGFSPVSLGPRVLRTETAGPVVTALVMARLGELS